MHDVGESTATPDAPDPDESPSWDAPDPDETAADSSDLDAFLLARLARFIDLASDPVVQELPAWYRLAEHAVAAATEDCLARGLAGAALAILVPGLRDEPPAA